MHGKASPVSMRLELRAYSAAWIALAIVSVPLAPVPAMLLARYGGHVGSSASTLPQLLHLVIGATPVFAAIPFAFGAIIGGAVYQLLSSPERVGVTEAERIAVLGRRPMLASGLLVGMLFASMGLAFAMVLPHVW
jgi:hypothetical protein